MARITYVESLAELRYLYDNWALTFEGLDSSDIDQVVEFLQEHGNLTENEVPEAYITTGYYMNELCRLSGSNAYQDDLDIISFLPYGDILAMSIGARWMTDIIDNNADREGWHPFNNDEELEDQELIDELADEYEDFDDWDDFDDMYDDFYSEGHNDEDDGGFNDGWDEDHANYNESTQSSDVSVGEIYDYLKTKTLVKDTPLEDILKDKEATAWEYAFQKASEKNNGYDEEEFLNVYSKALKALKNKSTKKESKTLARPEKTEKLLKVLDILQSVAREPIELLHAEWFPVTDDNLLNDEEICEGVISKPFYRETFSLLMSSGFVIVNHYSDLRKFGSFNPAKAAYFQISDFELDRLFKELKGELE